MNDYRIRKRKYVVWDGDPNGDAFLVNVLDNLEDAIMTIDLIEDIPGTNFFISTFLTWEQQLKVATTAEEDDIPF
jgi:hypothetical protein